MVLRSEGARALGAGRRPGLETAPGLIVYRFGADLFYANADRFADEVRALVDARRRRFAGSSSTASAISDIDYSAARTVRDLLDDLARRKVRVVLARVNPFLRSDMPHGMASPRRSARRGFSRRFTRRSTPFAPAALWPGRARSPRAPPARRGPG